MERISESTKISEILSLYPELTDYLMELDLCGCGYGPDNSLGWELSRAAKEKGLELQSLLRELLKRIK